MIIFVVLAGLAVLAWIFLSVSGSRQPRRLLDGLSNVDFADYIRGQENWVVLDTETTGLGKGAEVLEIAIVDKHGAVILDTLVRPKGPIQSGAQAIHGISRKMAADSPPWPEIAKRLENIAAENVIIAYNAEFDVRMIAQTFEKWGLAPCKIEAICAMNAYSDFCGDGRRSKLIDASAAARSAGSYCASMTRHAAAG